MIVNQPAMANQPIRPEPGPLDDRDGSGRSFPAASGQLDLETSSEALAASSQDGDPEAFAQLVERHTDRVYRLLAHWVGNPHDAEDLTQETFLRAYQSIRRFTPSRPFLPWLLTIARRVAATHWRQAHPSGELGLEVEADRDDTDPATRLISAERSASLWHEARRLKPRQYQALWLHYAEGLAIADVARVLGTNTIHIKVLLHRGRRALARRLDHPNVSSV